MASSLKNSASELNLKTLSMLIEVWRGWDRNYSQATNLPEDWIKFLENWRSLLNPPIDECSNNSENNKRDLLSFKHSKLILSIKTIVDFITLKSTIENKVNFKGFVSFIEEVYGLPEIEVLQYFLEKFIEQQPKFKERTSLNNIKDFNRTLQKNEYTEDDLNSALVTLEYSGYKDLAFELEEYIADHNMKEGKFRSSEKGYKNLIEKGCTRLQLITKLASAQRNYGNKISAIETLNYGIEVFGRKPQLLHLLAVNKRDSQEFSESVSLVDEILELHPSYALSEGFSIFAADILRKDARYRLAFRVLKKAAYNSTSKNFKNQLNVKAMLAELNENSLTGIESFFEVSSTFYDYIYLESEKYSVDSRESVYVPVWDKVCELVNDTKVKQVIDIGCGPAQFAEYFQFQSPEKEYLGLDFSEIAIGLARKRCPQLKFLCEDVNKHMPSASGNVIYVLLEVLEHIKYDLQLIEQLPVGSMVIFSVPNFDSFGHVRFFSDKFQVIDRFSDWFYDFDVIEISLSETSKIFIGKGYRS